MTKVRVRLTDEEVARIWPPKHRVTLPPEFDLEAYMRGMEEKRARFRLPNIPNHDECKYIFGEVGDHDARYCGKKTKDGTSWCEEHHAACTRKIIHDGKRFLSYRRSRRPL